MRGWRCLLQLQDTSPSASPVPPVLYQYLRSLPPSRHFRDESEKFLSDVLLPNLVWRAGRTAAAIRTSALSCLLALLHGGAVTPGQVRART